MCSNHDEVPRSLQSLPRELRIRIFEHFVTQEDLQTLRGVSTLLKFEIDQEVGLKKNVNFRDDFSEASKHGRTIFLRSVALQAVTLELDSKMLLDIRSVLARPSKLRHCVIGGRIHCQLLYSLLFSSSNLSSLSVTGIVVPPSTTSCSMFEVPPQPDEEESSGHLLRRLKSLEVSLRQGPLGEGIEAILTSQEVLRSIAAPRLSKFDLKIDFDICTAIHIFRTIVDFVTFVNAHPSLTSISISFVGNGMNIPDDGDPLTPECLSLYKTVTRRLGQFKKSIQLGRFAKLEEFLLESNSDELTEKDVAGLFVEALESPVGKGNMKKLGFKIGSYPNWEKTLRTLTSYHETLKEIFIESKFAFSVDFRSFGVCGNLESVSIHDTRCSDFEEEERRVGVLSNVAEGLELLEKLRVFIVNELLLSRADVLALSLKPLRVLGLREVALRRPVDPVEGDGGDAFLSGIPLEAFVNMLSNRNLEALLVDLFWVIVTSLQSGREFSLMNERLIESGNIRTSILDISASEDEGKCPYWNSRGFPVKFPLF